MRSTISPHWHHLTEIYCSCIGCDDKLVVTTDWDYEEHRFRFTTTDESAQFYFKIVYSDPPNLWQRIRSAWFYLWGYKTNILNHDDIMINMHQMKRLVECFSDVIEKIERQRINENRER